MVRNRTKVLVMMSGGVDSSVAAYLLKEGGYEVTGVTLKLWSSNKTPTNNSSCCSPESIRIAKRAAQQMRIPHYVMDWQKELEKTVVIDFLENYLKGRTPNPCSRCNQWIKFGLLLNWARSMGFDYLATGHHARIERNGIYYLKKGLDKEKDQSYFLHALDQQNLPYILFPIGEYHKEEVRDMASDMGLACADRPESQDICFLPHDNYRKFIKRKAKGEYEEGEIVDLKGNILGRHEGIPFYTVGQRRGLGLGLDRKLYVVGIDPVTNRIVVGAEENLYSRRLVATQLSFVYRELSDGKEPVEAKIRYRSDPEEATIKKVGKRLMVNFKRPRRAIAPGQIVVFYKGDKVFGGGTIQEVV